MYAGLSVLHIDIGLDVLDVDERSQATGGQLEAGPPGWAGRQEGGRPLGPGWRSGRQLTSDLKM